MSIQTKGHSSYYLSYMLYKYQASLKNQKKSRRQKLEQSPVICLSCRVYLSPFIDNWFVYDIYSADWQSN